MVAIINLDPAPSGSQGIQGIQGVQGDAGPSGVQGIQGTQGIQGIQGNTGPSGATGLQGNTGSQGPQGNVGPSGSQGTQGPSGLQGDTGEQGIQGVQGPNSAFRVCPSGTTVIGVTGGLLEDDLSSYWKLGEASGNDRVDTLANDDLKESIGAVPQLAHVLQGSGVLGSGVNLEADNKYLMVQASAFNFIDADTFTFSFWILEQDTFGTLTQPIALSNGFNQGWLLQFEADGGMRFLGLNNPSPPPWSIFTTNGVLQSGVFQHVVLTRENNGGPARVYLNNVLIGEQLDSGTTDYENDLGGVHDFFLGGQAGGSQAINAFVDEMAFWTRGISAQEVTSLYNSGSGNFYDNLNTDLFDLATSAAEIWNQVSWLDIAFDLGNEFVVASGGFIPQSSGAYTFHTRITVDDIASEGEVIARIQKNYSETVALSETMRNDSGGILPLHIEIAGTTLASSGDIFTVEVKHNQFPTKLAGASGTFFDGWKLAGAEQGDIGPSGAQGLQGIQGVIGPSGSEPQPATYFQAYVTDTVELTETFADIPFDIERVKDTNFVHDPSGAIVTVLADGTYTTFCFICTELTSTGETVPVTQTRFMRSGPSGYVEIPGSRGAASHDDPSNIGGCITTPLILPLASGDSIKLQARKTNGPDTVVISSGTSITLIDVGGAKGDPGPSGFGPAGAAGPQGPQGDTGPSGVPGPSGTQGVDGADGAAGADGATGPIGPSGLQGIQGVPGDQGIQGDVGPSGASGVAGLDAGICYHWASGIVDINPGSGIIGGDNTDQTAITLLRIHNTDLNSFDQEPWIATWDDSTNTPPGHITVKSRDNRNNGITFQLDTLTPQAGPYFKADVTFINQFGSAFVDNENLSIFFARAGDQGDIGPSGVPGPSGVTGPSGGVPETIGEGDVTNKSYVDRHDPFSLQFLFEDLSAPFSRVVWRADKDCLIDSVLGYRVAGTSGVINFIVDGVDVITAAGGLPLTVTNGWSETNSPDVLSIASGQTLEAEFVSHAGASSITAQLSLSVSGILDGETIGDGALTRKSYVDRHDAFSLQYLFDVLDSPFSRVVWRADKDCLIDRVLGYREGGASGVINFIANGVDVITAAGGLPLTVTSGWTITNSPDVLSIAAGQTLEVEFISGSGASYITAQIEMSVSGLPS